MVYRDSLAGQTSFCPLSEGGKESGHYSQDFVTRRNAAINHGHMTAITTAAALLTLNVDSARTWTYQSRMARATCQIHDGKHNCCRNNRHISTLRHLSTGWKANVARNLDTAGQTPPLTYNHMTMHYNYWRSAIRLVPHAFQWQSWKPNHSAQTLSPFGEGEERGLARETRWDQVGTLKWWRQTGFILKKLSSMLSCVIFFRYERTELMWCNNHEGRVRFEADSALLGEWVQCRHGNHVRDIFLVSYQDLVRSETERDIGDLYEH